MSGFGGTGEMMRVTEVLPDGTLVIEAWGRPPVTRIRSTRPARSWWGRLLRRRETTVWVKTADGWRDDLEKS